MDTELKAVGSNVEQSSATRKNCSNCGKEFHCGATVGVETGELSCWCTELPRVGMVGSADQDCFCPECLTAAIGKLAENQ